MTSAPVLVCNNCNNDPVCQRIKGEINSFQRSWLPGYLRTHLDLSMDLNPRFHDFESTIDTSYSLHLRDGGSPSLLGESRWVIEARQGAKPHHRCKHEQA
jgi:hypothetical protein